LIAKIEMIFSSDRGGAEGLTPVSDEVKRKSEVKAA
jgi:hypothetical protein